MLQRLLVSISVANSNPPLIPLSKGGGEAVPAGQMLRGGILFSTSRPGARARGDHAPYCVANT